MWSQCRTVCKTLRNAPLTRHTEFHGPVIITINALHVGIDADDKAFFVKKRSTNLKIVNIYCYIRNKYETWTRMRSSNRW